MPRNMALLLIGVQCDNKLWTGFACGSREVGTLMHDGDRRKRFVKHGTEAQRPHRLRRTGFRFEPQESGWRNSAEVRSAGR